MNEFYEELKRYWIFLTGMFGRRLFCAAKMPERSGFFPGFLLKTKNKMKDRTKRKGKQRKSGCEGKSRIFRERIGRIPRLVICGGGHVSAAATKLGKMLGFEVTVLEDRPKFADHVRKAGADNVICAPFKEGLAKIGGDSDTWFVIVTRGHRYDAECLEIIVEKQNAYIGMMGSKRRVAIVKDQLEKKVSTEKI